jgi:hypothetical protein
MSDTKSVHAVRFDSSGSAVDDIKGVKLCALPPFTILLVRTMNSLYRVVSTPGPEVYVQGGAYFPDLTSAYLDGARSGESSLDVGWIGVGLLVQFRSGDQCIITSPVLAITTEQLSGSVVH